jgi:hypothetical protein
VSIETNQSVPESAPDPATDAVGGPRRSRRLVALVAVVAAIVPSAAIAQSTLRGDDPGLSASEPIGTPTAPAPSPAIGAPPTAENEATRSDLERYFDELQALVDSQEFARPGQPQLPVVAADLSAAVESATALIAELDGAQLTAWQNMADASPGWENQPAVLAEAVASNPFDLGSVGPVDGYRAPATLPAAANRTTGETHLLGLRAADSLQAAPAPGIAAAGTYTNCQNTQPDIRALFYSAWVATQVAGAAGAIASGVPSAVTYVALTIITGVAYGVANGIAIALNHALTIALDCAAAQDDAEFRRTLPTDPSAVTTSNPTGITPGSTQTSVDELSTAVAGVATTLDQVDEDLIEILDDQLTVMEALGIAVTSASEVQALANELRTRAQDLRANVGSASDAADEARRDVPCVAGADAAACNTANGLANTIDVRLDTILGNTADLESLTLRMSIERALADPSHQPVGLFALPQAQGGELETVRDIVIDTIARLQAAGQGTGNAASLVATANASLAAGDFVGAYVNFAQAYQSAVR